jgi:hypothetical protein
MIMVGGARAVSGYAVVGALGGEGGHVFEGVIAGRQVVEATLGWLAGWSMTSM